MKIRRVFDPKVHKTLMYVVVIQPKKLRSFKHSCQPVTFVGKLKHTKVKSLAQD